MDTATNSNSARPAGTQVTRGGWTVRLNPRTLWLAAAIVATLLLAIFILSRVFNIVVLVFPAIVFAEGIRPVVVWLHARHIPRPLGTLLVYLALLAALAGVGCLIAAPLIAQSAAFINSLPKYTAEGQNLLTRVQHTFRGNPMASQALQALQSQGGYLVGQIVMILLRLPISIITGLSYAIFVLMVAIQQFESNVLVPSVMNRAVKLHPLVVVIVVVMGGELYGILGAILAVPFAVIGDILVVDMLAPLARHVSAQVEARHMQQAAQPISEATSGDASGTGP
jgi:predicted PurR-regulated permease PerM